MNLLPLSDHLILAPTKADSISDGGIHLPANHESRRAEGIVLAVGPGKRGKNGQRIPLEVKVGDRVLCNKASADPIRWEGKEYKVVSIRDVLCVL